MFTFIRTPKITNDNDQITLYFHTLQFFISVTRQLVTVLAPYGTL